jgi:N-acetylneuraminic acid mutarotase
MKTHAMRTGRRTRPFATLALAVWIPLAPVQVARQEVAVAAAVEKVYLFGGIGDGEALDSVEQYDPSANAWHFVAPLPSPRHHAAAAAMAEAIYIIGGYSDLAFTPVASVFRYDVAADVWTRVADLPRPRGALAAAVIDGRIYAAGGAPGGRDLTVYDPSTNQWTALAPMPTPREHLAAVAFGGKLYVVGGRLAGNTAAFESYDPATDRWESLPPLPTPRSGLAAAVAGGRIYVFGGEGNPAAATGVFPENESYDFASRTWRSELPMPLPRHGIGAAFVAGRIVIPAGAPVQGFGRSAMTDAFEPDVPPRRRSVRH